jgi:hypothetical protein
MRVCARKRTQTSTPVEIIRRTALVGPDASSFSGVSDLACRAGTESRALQGAYCNIKGRVVADVIVLAH